LLDGLTLTIRAWSAATCHTNQRIADLCYRYYRLWNNRAGQALLEAHELASGYFGGVFRTLRPDFVPGYKIVILFPAALCGLGPAKPPLSRGTS
jgi:hypothetical protein